jgi:creatinine amidohydrolase
MLSIGGYEMIETVLWEELKWAEIKELASQNAVVIVPVASTEQHGPHLPVSTDAKLVTTVATRVAKAMREGGVPGIVAPTVWTGNSLHHMLFPGTISLDYEVFSRLMLQICLCINHHGFSRIVLLNGHGGNEGPLRVAITEINQKVGHPVFGVDYWDPARKEMAEILQVQTGVRHSGEAETSLMLHLYPELVGDYSASVGPDRPDPEELSGGMAYTFRTYKDRTRIGVIGDARPATAEKGKKMLECIVERLAELFSRPSLWEITL